MPATMKALAAAAIGPVTDMTVIELPVPEPGPGQVRVKVHFSAVNPADQKSVLGTMTFLHGTNLPMVVGYDFSGTVDAVGKGVEGLAVGRAVFGFLKYSRSTRQGAFAQYLVTSADNLAPKPEGVGHALAAAAATVGVTALQALRGVGLAAGQRVLVTGASGGVGSIAIGVARRMGAKVDALSSKPFLGHVAGLGAETVYDRGEERWRAEGAGRYDVILDAAAAYSYSGLRSLLKRGGRYSSTLPKLSMLPDFFASRLRGQGTGIVMVNPLRADLAQLGGWLADGLAVPIAQTYPLERGGEALARSVRPDYFGKLVLTLD